MSHPNELLNELRIDRSAKQAAPEGKPWMWIALVAIALVAIVASYFLFGREEAIEVKTATATAMEGSGGGSASVLDASGYVTARRIATVSSKITGKVKEVFIEEGQRVAEGEVLATLDAADADAQRELAQSQLASAQSQLAEARAQLVLADRTLVRQKELAAKKLVAQSALDTAEADRASRASRLQSLERAVKVARDGVQISALGVDNTVIRAPFAGVIVAKAAQPGEMISPISGGGGSIRTGIGTLVDMDSLEIQVDVNEAYIGRVQPKMPVEAVLNAYPDWKIPAEVIAIVPTADRSKATVKVRIALNQKDPRIVPDMGVRVSFLETTPPAAAQTSAPRVQVPVAAVRKDGTQDIVFVMKDGKAERRAIKAGGTIGDQRQVLAGLNGGEQVIVEAPDTLKEGDDVRLAETK